jgi:hypothetical protein
MCRVREMCIDFVLAIGLVWLMPFVFVFLALLLPLTGVIKLVQSLVERV